MTDAAETAYRKGLGAEKRVDRRAAAMHFARAMALEPDNAGYLSAAARMAARRERYDEAMALYGRNLEVSENALGPEHPEVAAVLVNLAFVYRCQENFDLAEPLCRRAIAIREKAFGIGHELVDEALDDLAGLHNLMNRPEAAETLYKHHLEAREKAFGPDHPCVAATLGGLAEHLWWADKFEKIEPLYRRAIEIRAKAFGIGHEDVADTVIWLGMAYERMGRPEAEEALYKQHIEAKEKAFGRDHPGVAPMLNILARMFMDEERYAEAAPLCVRAVAITEDAFDPGDRRAGDPLAQLIELETKYRRYFETRAKELGADHPELAGGLNDLATLNETIGFKDEAAAMRKRAREIEGGA